MTGTNTVTRSTTVTLVDVRHVIWRLQGDLRVLRALHRMIDVQREEALGHDLQLWVYRGYTDQITFRFVTPSRILSYALQYTFTRGRQNEVDEASGGLKYQSLEGAEFEPLVTPKAAWLALTTADRKAFQATLQLQWGPASPADDGAGAWVVDRKYGNGALGAVRAVYRSA